MHVFLTILKIIGIILLVILGILLFLLLVYLFVPLRYRLRVTRQNEVLEANGRMTWLLHLLRSDLTYKEKQGTVVFRVCGFKVKTVHFPKKKEEPSEEAALAEPAALDASEEGAAAQIEASGKAEAESTVEASLGTEEERTVEASGKTKADGAEKQSFFSKLKSRIKSFGRKRDTKEEHTGTKEKGTTPGFISKLMDVITRIVNLVLELLLQVPGLPAEVYDRIEQVLDKIEKKTDAVFRKIDPFLSIEAEHMLEKGIRYVQFLIRGYAPRKISGYIHFGTGSPDITGWLTGLIYVVLPESGTEYDVDPDFYEAVLETDTLITGHIRMYRITWVFIRLLLDKEFRTLYRAIRGKDKNSGHRGSKRARRKALKEKEKAEKAA